MPSISRIRIVNLYFNKGARFIPDLNIGLEDSNGESQDTLISIDNGGGKTVLTQMVIQVVRPSTTLAKRTVSEYFPKSTDHAFILIEWNLDNTTDKLLTGIAIAAAVNTGEDGDGSKIRHYTFINRYNRLGDKYDIKNIPLEEVIGGKYKVAGYEEIRTLLRNARNSNVQYFSREKVKQYKAALSEYGINQMEWENIIIRINQEEHGVSEFFDKCTTTDSLLDNFIIKGINGNSDSSTEDRKEVEEMFSNFAERYAKQKEQVQQREETVKFIAQLEEMMPDIETLWNLSESKRNAIETLFDYIFSVASLIDKVYSEKGKTEREIEDTSREEKHIDWEKISLQFHNENEEHTKALCECTDLEERQEHLRVECNKYARIQKVLLAAKAYAELIKNDAKLESVLVKIREKETEEDSDYMRSLRYSLEKVSQSRLETLGKQKQSLQNELNFVQTRLLALKDFICELEKKKTVHEKQRDNLEGKISVTLENIEESLAEINVYIDRMLDGSFSKTQIDNVRFELNSLKVAAEEKLQEITAEEQMLSEEKEQITEKNTANQIMLSESERENNDLEQLVAAYWVEYNCVIKILDRISLRREALFSEKPIIALNADFAEKENKLRVAERSYTILKEELENAKKGRLHISNSAIAFLDETGIDYKTGEQYLIGMDEGLRRVLLENNPVIAYSIIVNSESERRKLLQAGEFSTWVSSLVPVYTYADVNKMTEDLYECEMQSIALYSKPYFIDNFNFTHDLEDKLKTAENYIEAIKKELDETRKEIETLRSFRYEFNYEEKLKERQSEILSKIDILKAEQDCMKKRKEEIAFREMELRRLAKKANLDAHNVESKILRFNNVCERIIIYHNLCADYVTSKRECEDLAKKLDEERELSEIAHREEADIKTSLKEIEESISECENLLSQVKGSMEADLLEKSYEELKSSYSAFLSYHSEKIGELLSQRDSYREEIRRIREYISDYGVDEREYTSMSYSAESYKDVSQRYENANSEYSNVSARVIALKERVNLFSEAIKKTQGEIASEYNGEVLPKSEIGTSFKERREKCAIRLRELNERLREIEKKITIQSRNLDDAHKLVKKNGYASDKEPAAIDIEYFKYDDVKTRIEDCANTLVRAERKVIAKLKSELGVFKDENALFSKTIRSILECIGAESFEGDKYYTLSGKMEGDIKRYKTLVSKLDIELKDIEESKKQLSDNLLQRAQMIYDGLTILSTKSKVMLSGSQRQMLKILLPEAPDRDEIARRRMLEYIDASVNEYITCIRADDYKGKESKIHQYTNMRRLLNCYIGKEEIPIQVYKIDKNPKNSGYRTWEQALKENSGAERFVVFLALILAMMNYSRGLANPVKKTSGVLIMDNPFGPISSEHLLRPMFDIAHHFRIQLICLSHLATTEVCNCFTNVYKCKNELLPLSNIETFDLVSTRSVEVFDSAFYRTEQISLF